MNYLKHINYIPFKRYNPETTDYRDRVIANGGTISEATLDAIEKFVQDCKNALIWDKFLEVAPFAGGNLSAAMVKLVYTAGVASVITNVNFVSGDYTETGASGGLLGDGATKYLNTGFNAQTYLPDNAHLSFYLREDVSAAGNRSMLGALTASDQYWIGSLVPASQVNARLGQTHTGTLAAAFNKGFYIGSRTASNLIKLYKNGATVASDSTSVTHTKPNLNIYAFGWNSLGTAAAYLPARGSFYSVGQALTDAESAVLNDAVQTLQRNLNRNIS
jgi:hypothetical protein